MSERRPQATARRIEPLATLPLFHRLDGRKTVLAGHGEGALWKAELLAAAGAELHVFAGAASASFAALADDPAVRRVHVHAREWLPADLDGAALAVADLDDAEAIRAFVAAARKAGAPVNIVDKPEFCDFAFGALVNRSPLVVAVSTDGAAPVFGQAIRAKIEALLPAGLKSWAQAAADWRPSVQARELPFALRRAFWELFAGKAMAEPQREPTRQDAAELFARLADLEAAHDGKGRVTLVGAGPGDPELLTLKAVRALQSADIILYDDLVSPGVLDFARREAKRMLVGKTGYGPSVKQGDINALIRFRDANAGQDPKAVMIVHDRAAFAIIGRRSRGISPLPASLEGRKLGAPAGDAAFAQWPIFGRLNRIDEGKVKLENIGFAVREPMLASGEVDGFFGYGPSSLPSLKARGVPADDIVAMSMADHGLLLYGHAVMVSAKFAASEPGAVRGLLRAILRGIRDVAADPEFGAQLIVRRAENAQPAVERERLALTLEQNVLTPHVRQHGIGAVDPVRWGQALDQLAQAQPFKDRGRAADSFTDAYLPARDERLF